MICLYCGKPCTFDDIVPADRLAIAAHDGKEPTYSVHIKCDRPTIDSVPMPRRGPVIALDDLDAIGYIEGADSDPTEEK